MTEEKSKRLDNLYLEPLKSSDLRRIRTWGLHEDPMLFDYNLPNLSNMSLQFWYAYRRESPSQEYFSINRGEAMLGYVGLKEYDFTEKSAFLAISLDPNLTSQGIGTKAMELIMDYFFTGRQMEIMKLEVNAFNHRAIGLYKKLGFKKTKTYGEAYKAPKGAKIDQEILDNPEYFYKEDGKYFMINHQMELTKSRYEEIYK